MTILASEHTPTDNDRLAIWAARYYGAGHHKEPREPLTPATPPRYANEGVDAADLPPWHPDSWHYAGP